MKLHDRTYAAFLLEEKVRRLSNPDALVLAISNGGVPLGYRLSSLLHLPLQVIANRKIYHPVKKDLPIGAVCGDEVVLSTYAQNLSHNLLSREIRRAKELAKEYRKSYEEEGFFYNLTGKTVFLVDDGANTGNTISACIRSIRKQLPARVIVAVPVLSAEAKQKIQAGADQIVSLFTPHNLQFISYYYDHFPKVSDNDVRKILLKAAEDARVPGGAISEAS